MEEIKKEIRTALAAITEIDEADIDDDANFADDIGLDSLQALELLVNLEKKYKIEIPQEELSKFTSVNSVAEIVTSFVGQEVAQV